MTGLLRILRARFGRAAAVARRRPAGEPRVRLGGPGAEPRTLAPGDPALAPLVTAAEALLSAAQRVSRG